MSGAGELGLSVIMPIKGQGQFLRTALDSMARQAVLVDELIVIDDGIEAESIAVDLEYAASLFPSVRILKGPGTGPAAARNIGIEAARGAIIGFLDDDDIWPDDKLARQYDYLLRHPELEAVGGRIHWFSHWDSETLIVVEQPGDPSILHVNLGAYLYRRRLFEQVGTFDAGLLFSEDVDFLLRIIDHDIKFALFDQVTLYYRRHNSTMTAMADWREKRDFNKTLFRSLRRRRDGVMPAGGLQRLEAYLVQE